MSFASREAIVEGDGSVELTFTAVGNAWLLRGASIIMDEPSAGTITASIGGQPIGVSYTPSLDYGVSDPRDTVPMGSTLTFTGSELTPRAGITVVVSYDVA